MTQSIFKLLTLLFIMSALVACDPDDDDMMDEQNIVELASDTEDLSSLVAAVQRAGLVETLSSDGPFTVFAPTNAAFSTFLASAGFSGVDQVPVEVLRNILLNHVFGGTIRSTDLATGYGTTSAVYGSTNNNLSIYINTDGSVTLNGISNVTSVDIEASNGIVHIVDAVIGLPTITTFAAANPDFSILVEALTRADLTANYAEVLSGAGPFTVFAPTNAAFAALLTELGATSLDDVPAALLEQVLLYHVVGNANVRAADLSEGQQVTTLQTQSFTIGLTGGPSITDARGREVNIILTDVQAANGVVHAIDRVLLPQE